MVGCLILWLFVMVVEMGLWWWWWWWLLLLLLFFILFYFILFYFEILNQSYGGIVAVGSCGEVGSMVVMWEMRFFFIWFWPGIPICGGCGWSWWWFWVCW